MRLAALVALASIAALACEPGARISDTGYVGTWERGNDKVRSRVAIRKDGAAYRFRWTQSNADASWTVACDWEGECTEHLDGAKIAAFRFQTSIDPESGHLLVDVLRSETSGGKGDYADRDELVLEPGGLKLWSYTVQHDGQPVTRGRGPARLLTKVSNATE